MNTIFRNAFVGLLLISFSGCGESNLDKLNTALANGITKSGYDSLLDKPYLLIVPRIGCMGCISSAEMFILEAYKEHPKKLNILLSDITSYKVARVRFGSELLEAANVFVDKNWDFDIDFTAVMYPLVIRLNNGDISQITPISPENEFAIENLRTELEQ